MASIKSEELSDAAMTDVPEVKDEFSPEPVVQPLTVLSKLPAEYRRPFWKEYQPELPIRIVPLEEAHQDPALVALWEGRLPRITDETRHDFKPDVFEKLVYKTMQKMDCFEITEQRNEDGVMPTETPAEKKATKEKAYALIDKLKVPDRRKDVAPVVLNVQGEPMQVLPPTFELEVPQSYMTSRWVTAIVPSRAVYDLHYELLGHDYLKIASIDGKLGVVLYPPTVTNLDVLYNTVAEGVLNTWAYAGSDLEGGVFVELDFKRGLHIGTGVMWAAFALSGTLLTGSTYIVSQDMPIISRALTTQYHHDHFEALVDLGSYLLEDVKRWKETIEKIFQDGDEAAKKLAIKSYIGIVHAINECQFDYDEEEEVKKILGGVREIVWDFGFPEGHGACICGWDGAAGNPARMRDHHNSEHVIR